MGAKRFPSQQWLRRDRTRKDCFRQRTPMTVCVAALFAWNYAPTGSPDDFGVAAILTADRMITAGDVQYEPPQFKAAQFTPTTVGLVAGDFAYHSKAIKDTLRQINDTTSPENIATIYGQIIQSITRKEAEDLYLAPVGLNTDTFLAQQRDLADSFVSVLREQLQQHQGEETEAIIVGSETLRDRRVIRLFTVDRHGTVSCHDDVGYAAIGIGAWHARSRLMQYGYVSQFRWIEAVAAMYAAKKAAEIAPGVGNKTTDMWIIFRDHIEPLRPDIAAELPNIYGRYEQEHQKLIVNSVEELRQFVLTAGDRGRHDQGRGPFRTDAQTDASPNTTTAKASRKDEAGQKE